MKRTVEKFATDVVSEVYSECLVGEYGTWEDFCVEISVPEQIAAGQTLTVWGEENDEGERHFSLYVQKTNVDGYESAGHTNTTEATDLRNAIIKLFAKKQSAKRMKINYRVGGPVVSLDELFRQEFVYFCGKLYHNGWFGSWQLRWCGDRLKSGQIRYAIKEEEYAETDPCV